MTKFWKNYKFWLVVLSIVLIVAVLAALDGSGRWWNSWVAYAVMLTLGALSIFGIWKLVNADRKVTTAALVAFGLRLGVGVTLMLLLPVIGYQDNPEHLSGYIYTDAFIRDQNAWSLAISGDSLKEAYTGQYPGDQYGGMLALSALIYRFLSPDAHRPFMILILGASVYAWGVLFLWKGSSAWFGAKTALLAAWLFAVYPESVLLGSSQMREAIVIPVLAIPYFGLTEIQAKKKTGWIWIALSAIILFAIQPLIGFISFAVLIGAWLFDPDTMKTIQHRQTIITIFLLFGILLVSLLVASSILAKLPSLQSSGPLKIFLDWFTNNFAFQSYVTERMSGIFQSLLDSLGEQWRWLIVMVYGIAQPVLPAIVGDPSAAWIMRIVGFLRAVGWYALALFLVYGFLGIFRSTHHPRRIQLIWIGIATWAWIIIAALNAGADQWDNPRYRVVLLIWQVILAAWAWGWARSRNDAWLWRWLAVEVVFVGLFTEWYLGRYYTGFIHLDVKIMTVITLVISALILISGVIWDRTHKIPSTERDSSL